MVRCRRYIKEKGQNLTFSFHLIVSLYPRAYTKIFFIESLEMLCKYISACKIDFTER